MQTSKILGATFAVALGATAFWGLGSGLEAAQTAAAPCTDVRLSMVDQNKCATEVKSAATDAARQQVMAQYQSKAAMSGKSTTSPSATPPAATTPGADTTLPPTAPSTPSATPSPSAPATPE